MVGGMNRSSLLWIWMSKCCICWNVPSPELLSSLWWKVVCWGVCKSVSVPAISPSVFAPLPHRPDCGSPCHVPTLGDFGAPSLLLLFQSCFGCCRVLIYSRVKFRISFLISTKGSLLGIALTPHVIWGEWTSCWTLDLANDEWSVPLFTYLDL